MSEQIDPRLLNCASGSCCPAAAAFNANVKVCRGLGMDEEEAARYSKAMWDKGVRFVTAELAEAIGRFVDHPNRHQPEG